MSAYHGYWPPTGAAQALEDLRGDALTAVAVMIQKHVRRWIAQAQYKRTRRAILRIQAQMRMWMQRAKYRRQVAAATKIQAFARMIKLRKQFLSTCLGVHVGVWVVMGACM